VVTGVVTVSVDAYIDAFMMSFGLCLDGAFRDNNLKAMSIVLFLRSGEILLADELRFSLRRDSQGGTPK